MSNESIARYGRILLWYLVITVTVSGLLLRYLMPHEDYLRLVRLVAGEYAEQELVLAANPWTEASHRLLGVTMLVCGMLQFNPKLRRSNPRLHRWTGRVFLSLTVAVCIGAVIMGVGYPFSSLERYTVPGIATVLLWFAGMAWLRVRQRRFAEHREWMLRAFGLSLFIAVQRFYYTPMYLLFGESGSQRDLFFLAGLLATATTMAVAEWWIHRTRPIVRLQPQGSPA